MLGIIPHEGQAFLDDKEVKKSLHRVAYVEQKSISTTISYQGQGMCLTGTLSIYPALPHFKGQPLEKVADALEIVGLSDYADRQISQLSGGQFQRVLIARCLVQEADYIF